MLQSGMDAKVMVWERSAVMARLSGDIGSRGEVSVTRLGDSDGGGSRTLGVKFAGGRINGENGGITGGIGQRQSGGGIVTILF